MDEKDKLIADLREQLIKKDEVIAARDKTIASQETDLTAAAGLVAGLRQKLTAAEATAETAPAKPTLTVARKEYEFLSDFSWKGEEVTFEVLKANKKLAEELVKEGVGNLRLLTPEQA
ncbi:hypothetical protein [Arsenicibacter rosenii]|uniref:Uncharacterized protein n=1 Tax=Arsenicibacter rosenii TaxID=1750698 RepID=A0A1S2VN23_9BACT|nr:hypothetical protein [Arsenicibacter rosenii]OIN59800.1 hypothetical protein BLX24_08050 [Arsenicibacter rosenii]